MTQKVFQIILPSDLTCRAVRALYNGDLSFNLLYQSPVGNAPGTLVGLLLAHLHHTLLDSNIRLSEYRVR